MQSPNIPQSAPLVRIPTRKQERRAKKAAKKRAIAMRPAYTLPRWMLAGLNTCAQLAFDLRQKAPKSTSTWKGK